MILKLICIGDGKGIAWGSDLAEEYVIFNRDILHRYEPLSLNVIKIGGSTINDWDKNLAQINQILDMTTNNYCTWWRQNS